MDIMATFKRQTRVRAPLERVWEFHSTVDGLIHLTPRWANIRVEDLRLPEGAEGDVLVEGSEIDLSVKPFGVGPRQSWTSVITERREESIGTGTGRAHFVDEMIGGPMAEWEHTHTFRAVGEETIVRDLVRYRTKLGGPLDRLGEVGMALAFRDRHRRTREILGQA